MSCRHRDDDGHVGCACRRVEVHLLSRLDNLSMRSLKLIEGRARHKRLLFRLQMLYPTFRFSNVLGEDRARWGHTFNGICGVIIREVAADHVRNVRCSLGVRMRDSERRSCVSTTVTAFTLSLRMSAPCGQLGVANAESASN